VVEASEADWEVKVRVKGDEAMGSEEVGWVVMVKVGRADLEGMEGGEEGGVLTA